MRHARRANNRLADDDCQILFVSAAIIRRKIVRRKTRKSSRCAVWHKRARLIKARANRACPPNYRSRYTVISTAGLSSCSRKRCRELSFHPRLPSTKSAGECPTDSFAPSLSPFLLLLLGPAHVRKTENDPRESEPRGLSRGCCRCCGLTAKKTTSERGGESVGDDRRFATLVRA